MQQVECIYELDEYLDEYIVDEKARKIDKQQPDVIDADLEADLYEDIDVQENESKEVKIRRIKRYQKIVNRLKQKHGFRCQLCHDTFMMDNGRNYCEAHHIKSLSQNGSQAEDNVLILCPTHHRMFHYAKNSIEIGNLIDRKRIIKIGDIIYKVSLDGDKDIEEHQ